MATTIPISSHELKNRRKKLKTKRTLQFLGTILRTLFLLCVAGGSFWLVTLPNWVIRNSEHIQVEGNEFLSDNEVRSLIPLDYPQPLLTLSIPELTEKMTKKIPFENIVINREILPPQISIQVVEREPVAIAIVPVLNNNSKKMILSKVGYLDKKGILISNQFYQNVQDEKLLPTFKIIGNPEKYGPYWQNLFMFINQSTIKITEVDWQDPNNLILKTELGTIYIGAYSESKFPIQLSMLSKMKSLKNKIYPNKIVYIDLSDPDLPSLKQNKIPKKRIEEIR